MPQLFAPRACLALSCPDCFPAWNSLGVRWSFLVLLPYFQSKNISQERRYYIHYISHSLPVFQVFQASGGVVKMFVTDHVRCVHINTHVTKYETTPPKKAGKPGWPGIEWPIHEGSLPGLQVGPATAWNTPAVNASYSASKRRPPGSGCPGKVVICRYGAELRCPTQLAFNIIWDCLDNFSYPSLSTKSWRQRQLWSDSALQSLLRAQAQNQRQQPVQRMRDSALRIISSSTAASDSRRLALLPWLR